MAVSTKPTRKRKPVLDVKTVEWTETDDALASTYGVDKDTISNLRRMHGGISGGRDWEAVDWTKSDSVLSEELSVSRERVRQKRVALKMPKIPRRVISRSAQDKVANSLDIIANQSRIAAARTIGIAPSTLDKYRRVYNVQIRDGRFKLSHKLWNFDLPNADLEVIWDLKNNSAANTRSRLRKGPPKWNIQRGSVPTDPAYEKAYKKEEKKAAKFFSPATTTTDDSED